MQDLVEGPKGLNQQNLDGGANLLISVPAPIGEGSSSPQTCRAGSIRIFPFLLISMSAPIDKDSSPSLTVSDQKCRAAMLIIMPASEVGAAALG
eukprot:1158783-Pelagomonas_calceolata.AAC.2